MPALRRHRRGRNAHPSERGGCQALKDAGATLTLASPRGGQPPVDPASDSEESHTDATRRFETDPDAQAALAATHRLSGMSADDFDAVFYPGGHGPLWDLAGDVDSIRMIETFSASAATATGPPTGWTSG